MSRPPGKAQPGRSRRGARAAAPAVCGARGSRRCSRRAGSPPRRVSASSRCARSGPAHREPRWQATIGLQCGVSAAAIVCVTLSNHVISGMTGHTRSDDAQVSTPHEALSTQVAISLGWPAASYVETASRKTIGISLFIPRHPATRMPPAPRRALHIKVADIMESPDLQLGCIFGFLPSWDFHTPE